MQHPSLAILHVLYISDGAILVNITVGPVFCSVFRSKYCRVSYVLATRPVRQPSMLHPCAPSYVRCTPVHVLTATPPVHTCTRLPTRTPARTPATHRPPVFQTVRARVRYPHVTTQIQTIPDSTNTVYTCRLSSTTSVDYDGLAANDS